MLSPNVNLKLKLSLLIVLELLVLALVFFYTASLDAWSGLSFYTLYYILFIAAGLVIAKVAYRITPQRVLWIGPAIFTIGIVTLGFLDRSPAKPAQRTAHEIVQGMTTQEIQEVVNRNFPDGGKFKRPIALKMQPDIWRFVIDKEDCMFDAAYIAVEINEGKTVSAKFEPD